jgi:hypothetical protein
MVHKSRIISCNVYFIQIDFFTYNVYSRWGSIIVVVILFWRYPFLWLFDLRTVACTAEVSHAVVG